MTTATEATSIRDLVREQCDRYRSLDDAVVVLTHPLKKP